MSRHQFLGRGIHDARLSAAAAAQLVNLSSVYGLIAPPGETACAAGTFAVRGFTEAPTPDEIAKGVAILDTPTRTEPETAAEVIARGIKRRERRVLIGQDARQIAALVRLFPVGYWPLMARLIERTVQRASRDRR